MQEPSNQVVADADAMAVTAAQRIIQSADAAIEAHGLFSIALSGGNTPKPVYELLASPQYSRPSIGRDGDLFWRRALRAAG